MPPVKSKNGLKQGEFCSEFNDYLEKISCMNGNIVIVGDFNIDWLNTNGSERKRFYNILETFGFVQNICTETHRSHHLLDYNITRKDCNIISDCTVSVFHLRSPGTSCFSTMYTSLSSSKTNSGQSTPSDKG